MNLPEATTNPCGDCPWRRCSVRGWLGPFDADEWLQIVHSDQPIACHETAHGTSPLEGEDGWSRPGIKQCRGAAIFRENRFKLPRDPAVITGPRDIKRVFDTNEEFRDHHHDTLLAKHLAQIRAEG